MVPDPNPQSSETNVHTPNGSQNPPQMNSFSALDFDISSMRYRRFGHMYPTLRNSSLSSRMGEYLHPEVPSSLASSTGPTDTSYTQPVFNSSYRSWQKYLPSQRSIDLLRETSSFLNGPYEYAPGPPTDTSPAPSQMSLSPLPELYTSCAPSPSSVQILSASTSVQRHDATEAEDIPGRLQGTASIPPYTGPFQWPPLSGTTSQEQDISASDSLGDSDAGHDIPPQSQQPVERTSHLQTAQSWSAAMPNALGRGQEGELQAPARQNSQTGTPAILDHSQSRQMPWPSMEQIQNASSARASHPAPQEIATETRQRQQQAHIVGRQERANIISPTGTRRLAQDRLLYLKRGIFRKNHRTQFHALTSAELKSRAESGDCNECDICTLPLTVQDLKARDKNIMDTAHAVKTKCGHIFCAPCIWRWCYEHGKSSCPHCRRDLLSIHEPRQVHRQQMRQQNQENSTRRATLVAADIALSSNLPLQRDVPTVLGPSDIRFDNYNPLHMQIQGMPAYFHNYSGGN